MQFRLSQKEVRQNFGKERIISVGYCGAQNLLQWHERTGYNAGVNGWNFDLHVVQTDFGRVAVCTGYRPIGTACDWGLLQEYEAKAKAVHDGMHARKVGGQDWRQAREETEKLLAEWAERQLTMNIERRKKE